MRKCRLRLPRVVAVLSLSLLFVGVGVWYANLPRMKKYVLPGSGDAQLAHSALSFAYPADLNVTRGVTPNEVRVEHVPLTGLALWIEQRTRIRQVTDWDDTYFTVSYSLDETGIDQTEAEMRKDIIRQPMLAAQIRRVDHRMGPALQFVGQLPQQIVAGSFYGLRIYPKRSHITTPKCVVTMGYWSMHRTGSQIRQVVDDIAASMQIVPL